MIKKKIYPPILHMCCLIRKFPFTKLYFMSQENDALSLKNIPSCSRHLNPSLKAPGVVIYADESLVWVVYSQF